MFSEISYYFFFFKKKLEEEGKNLRERDNAVRLDGRWS